MESKRGLTAVATVVAALAVVASAFAAAGDAVTPPDVKGLTAAPAYKRISVSWKQPTYAGYDHVAIWEVIDDGTPFKIYTGKDTSITVNDVDNSRDYLFHVVTVDATNHLSLGNNVEVDPSTLLTAPEEGETVEAPPRLVWQAVPGAKFYNVQLYQNGVKLLSSWPRTRYLKLRPNWRFANHRRALRPGRFHWYVWPAFGTRAAPQYGSQLGASDFIVPGNACTAALDGAKC
jgi:hypothetical protein